MNYTQNEKIEQVTDTTLVVGISIGSQTHYARAFDNRGRELTKRVFSFQNDIEGFNSFYAWAQKLQKENNKTAVLIGCEPTDHYWFAFLKYVSNHQMMLVMVDPFSVKKIKELMTTAQRKQMQRIQRPLQIWWLMDGTLSHICRKASMQRSEIWYTAVIES